MATSDPSSHDFGLEGFQKMIEDYKAKEQQIMDLNKQLDQLKKENTRLQSQIKSSPDQFINNHHLDQRQKALELKNAIGKVVDEVLLNQEHTNRPPVFQPRQWTSGSNSNAHIEVNPLIELDENGPKSTNNNTINHVPSHTNHTPTSHEPIIDSHPQFNHAQVRPSDDNKLIGEATLSHHQQFPAMTEGKVDAYIPHNTHNIKRFVSNGHHFNNTSNPNSISLNNNPNKNNKKIKSDKPISNSPKYTVFIAWTGSMSQEGLRALFENDEVEDVRYLPNKQFAHVDLKTEAAKIKALKLNGEMKSQEQGRLRVEEGKPRGNNTTETNGPRSQQNKSYRQSNNNNNNNNNNKPNNYNSQQKHTSKYSPNGHHQLIPGITHEEIKEKTQGWHNFTGNPQRPISNNVYSMQSDNKSN